MKNTAHNGGSVTIVANGEYCLSSKNSDTITIGEYFDLTCGVHFGNTTNKVKHQTKPTPHNCDNCGGTIHNNICDYCGSQY